jgi:hypothetical protein
MRAIVLSGQSLSSIPHWKVPWWGGENWKIIIAQTVYAASSNVKSQAQAL